jgi:hypothetical protein
VQNLSSVVASVLVVALMRLRAGRARAVGHCCCCLFVVGCCCS